MLGDSGTIDSGMIAGGGMTLTDADMRNLRTAGKWARFMAILSLALMALLVLGLLFGGSSLILAGLGGGADDELGTIMAGAGVMVLFIYGLFILFAVYLYYLLYQFGSKAVRAVDSGDHAAMSEALAAQSRLYKIIGILTAVYLVLLAIGLIGGIVAGAAASF